MKTHLFFLFFFLQIVAWSQQHNTGKFDFPIPQNEINCMRQFNPKAIGVDPVNAFLLAKMTELMYPERLDYQIRYLQNDSKPVRSLPTTNWMKKYPHVVNSNFEAAYKQRFEHYFSPSIDSLVPKVSFHYIEKFKFDTLNFVGIKSVIGFDPELIVINTDSLVLILFRGTDDVNNNRFAEWKGTDFNFAKIESDSIFNNAMMHQGFLKSFDLVSNELIQLLDSLNAQKKSIWLSGHSLGGAMSILTGVYLQKIGYSVDNIYVYACPRAIGDKTFSALSDSILPNKIHRFEYYLDPVTILSTKGFEGIGKRYWFDNATKSNYNYYPECEERHFANKPLEYRRRPFAKPLKREAARIKREQMDINIIDLPFKFFYHNTQWYVYATYNLVPENVKPFLPKVDDSYPYIYYGWDKAK